MVVRLSRRKVGSTRNVSASSESRRAVVSQTRFELTIRSRSWPWRSVSAANTSPVLRTRARVSALWWSQHLEHLVGLLRERREQPERVVDRRGVVADGHALLVEPDGELPPGLRVERAQDLVELDRLRDLALREHAAVRELAGLSGCPGEIST